MIENIKHILLISSGKGGVGKSTVAANIAGALSLLGKSVGVLDADVHGPSQHQMFGIEYKEQTFDFNNLSPIDSNGIQILSSAAFRPSSQATVWQGAMVSTVINTMFFNTNWPELDVLVVDMPPGTGDVQIEICKKLPSAKAVIVTTPQQVALIDTLKGVSMFKSAGIEILGVVENMNLYQCRNCGDIVHLFGKSRTQDFLSNENLKLLGSLPIEISLAESADLGLPLVLRDSTINEAKTIIEISAAITAQLGTNNAI